MTVDSLTDLISEFLDKQLNPSDYISGPLSVIESVELMQLILFMEEVLITDDHASIDLFDRILMYPDGITIYDLQSIILST